VFERFTERARQVVVLAQDEARALKHNYIGAEHILLGLLREDEGLGAGVLESLGVTLDGVREQVERIVGTGDDATTGQIPFTPRAKKALELSLRETQGVGRNFIGTGHILLGVAREGDGVASRILLDFGLAVGVLVGWAIWGWRCLSGVRECARTVTEVSFSLHLAARCAP
jgi:ATP-dependent Clp protease ATP-binding subunit ClpC